MSEPQFVRRSVRPGRVHSPAIAGLTVRAKNLLHAVGVDLCAATRDDVLAGIDLVLSSPVRGCGETTRHELILYRGTLAERPEATAEYKQGYRDGARGAVVCQVRRAGKTDPPQDCDWPFCGCDPHADKVIAALQECGWGPSANASEGAERHG